MRVFWGEIIIMLYLSEIWTYFGYLEFLVASILS